MLATVATSADKLFISTVFSIYLRISRFNLLWFSTYIYFMRTLPNCAQISLFHKQIEVIQCFIFKSPVTLL